MTDFKVKKVIDGDTFKVEPKWKWDEKSGDTVRPTGYDTPEEDEEGYEEAKEKLKELILGEEVEVKNPQDIDHGRLVADAYYDGKDLADYFPEYQ